MDDLILIDKLKKRIKRYCSTDWRFNDEWWG